MWVQIRSAPNLMIAEMWREFFEAEGIPTRLLADHNGIEKRELAGYRVYIPQEKEHVAQEVLRKA